MTPQGKRWLTLLVASCLFYMAFIPIYIVVIFFLIIVDYAAAILIYKSTHLRQRRFVFSVSILSTCSILLLFKYLFFTNENLAALAGFFHWHYPLKIVRLVLPIGLSFHTFQSLSYVIEVYRGRQKPEYHFGIYALYVMFYPQLVAGPIERPQHLLPQFYENHTIEYSRVVNGLRLMLWGFFQKTVVADQLALYVDRVFRDPASFSSLNYLLAIFFFSFQILCDFGGYSNIAIGAAEVMGFRLMRNFNKPYFAMSVADFWHRWHISLSTWFRDYVYIPMGGNRVSTKRWILNILIAFLLSGLWHGPNWTFAFWGLLHAFYLIFSRFSAPLRKTLVNLVKLSHYPALHHILKVLITFSLVSIAWIFFRAASTRDAFYIFSHLMPTEFHYTSLGNNYKLFDYILAFAGIGIVLTADLIAKNGREWFRAKPLWFRWPIYYGLSLLILIFGQFGIRQFIYFQF